ncbi:hypothetical protein QBC38DRAFT_493093 [Podospora fimiseda]|uniref:Heat shock 70 kDa protein 12A n=1 Tax=Podospora fimiseda TaxID=252190 RepID=A0AAN7BEG3_9PEZI|nr:hypothetical protein QBC38DRAFT_493093 [Podospora fimiseda]
MAQNGTATTSEGVNIPEKYIAIGIDFGTTYSGVSWASSEAWTNSGENIVHVHDVLNWPQEGGQQQDELQVPTLIDPETGKWGMFCHSTETNPVRWIKLLLLEEIDLIEDLRKSKTFDYSRKRLIEAKQWGISGIVGLVARFLEEVWKHTLQEIKHEHGDLNMPLKVAIGVPAMWKPYVRERIKRAVLLAGILDTRYDSEGNGYTTTMTFVEEPQAAAIWTLREHNDQVTIEVGDTFVVCDGGGGTVDAITYMVTSQKPFRAQPVVQGKASLRGGFLIDQAFENYLYGPAVKFKFSKCSSQELRGFFNKEWEWTLKRRFDNAGNAFALTPPFAAVPARRWRTGPVETPQLHLGNGVVEGFFADTLTGIRIQIQDQLNAVKGAGRTKPKKIFFVGGLGGSTYLLSKVEQQYQKDHTVVLRPRRTWSAVARGAVITALERGNNYVIDPKLDRDPLDSEGLKLTLQMTWHVKKGAGETGDYTPESHEFHLAFGNKGGTGVNLPVTMHMNVAYGANKGWESAITSHELAGNRI